MKWFFSTLLLLWVPFWGFCIHVPEADYSLAPAPPSPPHFLGIHFGDNPLPILAKMRERGLVLTHREDQEGGIRILEFQGAPKELALLGGLTQLVFLEEKLIQAKISFPPSYENFLVIKDRLSKHFGERLQLVNQQENMPPKLRSHLAQLQKGEFNEETERAITKAVLTGSSFFFYSFRDTKNPLNITYAYRPVKGQNGYIKPKLELSVSSQKGQELLKERQKKKD